MHTGPASRHHRPRDVEACWKRDVASPSTTRWAKMLQLQGSASTRTNLDWHRLWERKRPSRRVLVGRWTGRDTTPSGAASWCRRRLAPIGRRHRHGRVADAAAHSSWKQLKQGTGRRRSATRCVQQKRVSVIFLILVWTNGPLLSASFSADKDENESPTKVCIFASSSVFGLCLMPSPFTACLLIIFEPAHQPVKPSKGNHEPPLRHGPDQHPLCRRPVRRRR